MSTISACKSPTTTNRRADSGPDYTVAPPDPGLKISAIRLFGAGGERTDRIFARGEIVFVRCLLQGLSARDRRIHLRAAMKVRGPEGHPVLDRPEYSAVQQVVPKGKATTLVEVAIKLPLSPAATPGAYQADVRFRDAISGEKGSARVDFKVQGPTTPARGALAIRQLHAPPDTDLRAGLPLHVDFEVLHARAVESSAPRRWRVHLTGKAELVDGSGIVRHSVKRSLTAGQYRQPPRAVPILWGIPIPAGLPTGEYLLKLSVRDVLAKKGVTAEHRFKLQPGGLGIYAVRLSGAGNRPRRAFMRGERLEVHVTVAGWASPAHLDLGLGLISPDHGFYLVRKKAHTLRNLPTGTTRRLLKIPLVIPEFAPRGAWTLKLRVMDHTGRGQASRDVTFNVTGPRILPQPTLRIQGLAIRQTPTGPPLPGLFLRAGNRYHFDFVVGGARLTKEQGYYHRVDLLCTLRLRDKQGRLVATRKRACEVKRRFSFQPLRLRLRSDWTLPRRALGLHQLEVEVLDRQSDRVSMLQRRVFVLVPR